MTKYEMHVEIFRTKLEAFLIGCDSVEEMGLWDKENLGEMDAFYANDMTCVIIRLIAADGRISQKEVDYLNATFDFKYSLKELIDLYEACTQEIGHAFDESFENGISLLRKINAKLADAYKELLALICDIIVESDGVITEAEACEVKRLKALCE